STPLIPASHIYTPYPSASHLHPLSHLQPLVQHLTSTLQPLVQNLTSTLQPLVQNLTSTLQPLVQNLTSTLQPLVHLVKLSCPNITKNIQCIRKVFRPLDFFLILLCYSLILKMIQLLFYYLTIPEQAILPVSKLMALFPEPMVNQKRTFPQLPRNQVC
uniref:Uncharacterized protein n=1 Tax=Oncorhynchus kisutch TaxID=8019 RepID=A0A8C7GFC2_ONCKI